MSNQSDDGDGVGYGKPPRGSRFKPGKSGNPKGRPKGTRNFKTDVLDTLETPVTVTTNGQPRKVSTQKATLLRLRQKALEGADKPMLHITKLAETYNNGEPGAERPEELAANDVALIELFKQQVLREAADTADPASDIETKRTTDEGQ